MPSFPSPKKGSLRFMMRRPSAKVKKPDRDTVAYVPQDQQIDNSRLAEPRCQTWSTSLLRLSEQSERDLIRSLVKVRLLAKFVTCPHCGHGKLSRLRKDPHRGYVQRCSARACHKFVLPHSRHPIFVASWGNSYVSLRQQALVLFCLVARVELGKIHLLTGLGRKVVESVAARWRKALVAYVEKKQMAIQLGDGKKWSQCEVDEVTCRGKRQGQKVTWFQYCGILKRGARKTLVLAKMKVKSTYIKQKGKGKGSSVSPGPITKAEWRQVANKFVKNKKILLHCDGARAYRYGRIPGVIADSVKHKRPKPIYTALWRHILPKDQSKAHADIKDIKKLPASEKEEVWVKKGTQLIDNVWRQLKLLGLPKSTKAEDNVVHFRVREFQWHHWTAEKDKWVAAGDVVQLLLNL